MSNLKKPSLKLSMSDLTWVTMQNEDTRWEFQNKQIQSNSPKKQSPKKQSNKSQSIKT